ncbi:TlpA family protein disulfide reductase [Miniimonas arenae]|uniref:TlpA family protein disulfide reductase n=2 Tax=Miniimonas arenae TaxID=676201 RepID=A0A5C5BG98_9MICO|nr:MULTISPECIES: TlpA disulfide reductase family protein [Miniimonas]TNU76745.1 TlpA family protein disulfide reductase [Miniimonas arenae]
MGALLAGGLVGCSAQGSDTPAVADAGYDAGDGSFTTWAPADRQNAIELTGETFDGQAVDLADWRGEVVVLNFWYADCPPCRVEAPDLAAIATDYTGQGVQVLGVNARDDAARVEAFNESFGVGYPSLQDSSATAVAALEGVVPLSAYPTTVVLDREGRPAARIMGLADGKTLRGLIDDTLAES